MNVTLRPASNADSAAIEQLVSMVLAEYGLQLDPAGTDLDLRDIETSYLTPGGAFDVLVDDAGMIIGSVGLCPVSSSTCELRKMYLVREARGCGLGRRLIEHALARAAELGFRRVVLETASVLQTAVSLYERYGFQRYTPGHLSTRCDAAYYLDLRPAGSHQE